MSSLLQSFRSKQEFLFKEACHPNVHIGKPFTESILETDYRAMLRFKGQYEIYIDNSEMHWCIMTCLNLIGSQFPYIVFETTTKRIPDYERLIPVMRVVENEQEQEKCIGNPQLPPQTGSATSATSNVGAAHVVSATDKVELVNGRQLKHVGTVEISLNELCQNAEEVRTRLGRYNLFLCNSQHFCNGLLAKIGLESSQQPTVAPRSLEEQLFDMCSTVFPKYESQPNVQSESIESEDVDEFKGY